MPKLRGSADYESCGCCGPVGLSCVCGRSRGLSVRAEGHEAQHTPVHDSDVLPYDSFVFCDAERMSFQDQPGNWITTDAQLLWVKTNSNLNPATECVHLRSLGS